MKNIGYFFFALICSVMIVGCPGPRFTGELFGSSSAGTGGHGGSGGSDGTGGHGGSGGIRERDACVPKMNCPVEYNCGTVPDECGGVIVCGECLLPQVCGMNNVCSCMPKVCVFGSCGKLDDGCGNIIDCGGCPDQVQGFPSACLSNVCEPFQETIFSIECGPVCGDLNAGAWMSCLSQCDGQNCTVEQACLNCNFLYSAEPDCLPCLFDKFPGQSCGG